MNQKIPFLILISGISMALVLVLTRPDESAVSRAGDGFPPRLSSEGPRNLVAVNPQSAQRQRDEYGRKLVELSSRAGTDLPASAGYFEPAPYEPTKPRLTFGLLGGDFELTEQAIEHLGLNSEEAATIQKKISVMRDELVEAVKQNIAVDPVRNDTESGISAFRIAPFPERGETIMWEFHHGSAQVLGKDRADSVLKLLNWDDHFGAFGKAEVLVQFQDIEDGEEMRMTAKWEERHAETGRKLAGVSSSYEGFRQKFGEVLQLSD